MADARPEEPASPADLEPFVEMALASIQREYPYHLTVVLGRDSDLALPRVLTPAFRGAFDWHSAVHGHWALARACRARPGAPWAIRARAALESSLTEARLRAEAEFLRAPGREAWERPYGLAWLLQLAAELRHWDDPVAARWLAAMEPLEQVASSRLLAWAGQLPWPVRSGEHSQSAFALGLFHDWARDRGHPESVSYTHLTLPTNREV